MQLEDGNQIRNPPPAGEEDWLEVALRLEDEGGFAEREQTPAEGRFAMKRSSYPHGRRLPLCFGL